MRRKISDVVVTTSTDIVNKRPLELIQDYLSALRMVNGVAYARKVNVRFVHGRYVILNRNGTGRCWPHRLSCTKAALLDMRDRLLVRNHERER